MTVSTVVDHNDYTGNGVTTSFPYTFRIFKKTDLTVSVIDLSENITVLVLDTDYTVTNAGGYNGGNVVLTTPLANGWQISIARELEPTQETDLRNQGKFFAEVHEDAFDKLTMLIQQAYSVFRLALRRPSSIANWYDALNNYIRNVRDPRDPQDAATKNYVDTVSSSNLSKTLRTPESIPSLPDASARANKMIAFDSSGIPIVVVPPSGSASDVLIELAKPTGSGLVHHHGENFPDQPLNLYLAWRNGDISAFGGKYSDSTAGAINKSAFADMESTFGGVRLNLMGKSIYLPDDMNLQVSSLCIWGGGEIHPGNGYNFYLKDGAFVDGKNFSAIGSTTGRPRLCGVIPGGTPRIGDVKFDRFNTVNRVEMFTAQCNTSTNPATTPYGVNSVSLTNFTCDKPYDFIALITDCPVGVFRYSNFKVTNMAGTFVQISITNSNPYEQQMQKAINTVICSEYSVINDDDFWADAANGYTSIGVIECWNLIHRDGYQQGVKIKNNGNAVYDMYNDARVVDECNITVTDCFGWNDHTMRPHKIKSAYQYSSQNKKWYYRRNYVSVMKALFPTITEVNSKGAFFWPETEDWHNTPIGSLEFGNRFIHIDNCDIELIALNTTNNSPVNNNIRLTNNHFSSLASGNVGFVYVSVYPYNIYQQIVVSDNRFDLPSATLTGLVRLGNGSGTGAGGFTGNVDISKNTGRFASLLAFTDYCNGNVAGYASMMLSISNNQFFATGNCRLTAPGQTPNMFDMSMCSGNYLKGSSINLGQLWNTQGAIEIGARVVGASPIVIFETGIPTTMNVSVGDRYINIDNGSSGVRVIKFTISKSSSTTTIAFTDDTSTAVTKTTGVNNGTFNMNVGTSAGFTVQCVVSGTSIIIQTASSLSQRFIVSGYSI